MALGTPEDDAFLIQYITSAFNRYTAGAQTASRLLNYVNRHYVKRAVDEDRGWIRLQDVLESIANNNRAEDTREKLAKKWKEKRIAELKKWGVEEDDSPEKVAFAEACGEAASPLDRVVPVSSLAHRRFRTEFIEPLLTAPKLTSNSKVKHKIPKAPSGSLPPRPKGRLARAVKDYLDSTTVEAERVQLIASLTKTLRTTGIRFDHPLYKTLDKFLLTVSPLPTKSLI